MIEVPAALWNEMLDRFSEQPQGVERIAFFDGVRLDHGRAIVSVLTIPNAECHPRWYTVSAENMSQAGQHLRARRMVRLAQVHTHGNNDTRHSPRDDSMAYSQLEGAVSIVLPFHAVQRPVLYDGSIHVKYAAGWRLLDHDTARSTVEIANDVLDFRRRQ